MKDRVALPLIGIVSAVVLVGVGLVLLGGRADVGRALHVSVLPTLNAFLNGTSALLLATGYLFIRRRRVTAHRVCMISALTVSTLFLLSYLTYHAQAGSVPFGGAGLLRLIYFPLLVSHIVLAAVIVPLALTTLYRALGGQFGQHKRIARVTLPIWLYVSVSGVVVYWMLYRLAGR